MKVQIIGGNVTMHPDVAPQRCYNLKSIAAFIRNAGALLGAVGKLKQVTVIFPPDIVASSDEKIPRHVMILNLPTRSSCVIKLEAIIE